MSYTSRTVLLGTLIISIVLCQPELARGAKFQRLHTFGAPGDAALPESPLVSDANGVLYGASQWGGAFQSDTTFTGGTVFSLTPPASAGGTWTEAVLWSFGGAGDGNHPYGVVIGSGGVLYGATSLGGANNGGTVFSLAPPSSPGGQWTEQILYSFTGGSDGYAPASGVILGSGGALYGTTEGGGSQPLGSGGGTVFRLSPPQSSGASWTETVLSDLQGVAFGPRAPLAMDANGVLYGTNDSAGGRFGSVFSVAPPSAPGGQWSTSLLHGFSGKSAGDGARPSQYVPVALSSAGVIYGTTFKGGPQNGGIVYSLTPPAAPGGQWTYAILHRFIKVSGVATKGRHPLGVTLDEASGLLYGATQTGGATATSTASGHGTLFSLAPPASGDKWELTVLHSFTGANGSAPLGTLVIEGNTLYGITVTGGQYSHGIAFSFTP